MLLRPYVVVRVLYRLQVPYTVCCCDHAPKADGTIRGVCQGGMLGMQLHDVRQTCLESWISRTPDTSPTPCTPQVHSQTISPQQFRLPGTTVKLRGLSAVKGMLLRSRSQGGRRI